jgi:transcriptional regulator with XRE-family HTH domain
MGRKRHRLIERRKTLGLTQERLAEAAGVDVATVARWERGETTPQPWHRTQLATVLKVPVEEVAAMLTESGEAAASGGPTVRYIEPDRPSRQAEREAGPAVHLHAWGALRTLEDLGVFLRSDMLTRRDILASSVTMAAGKALVDPIARWLSTEPTGLPAGNGSGLGRIGMAAVEGIERTVRHFAASDASAGGGVAREAAVGQLKYAVDLAQHAGYSEAVGNRLLTVIADLAGWVGWMSHDAGMNGPAQRYFWYGLQAAHEAGTEGAQLRAVGILTDLAIQAQAAGHLDTARRILDLALDRVPKDQRRFNAVRAILRSRLASVLSGMGAAHLSEVDRYVSESFDLFRKSEDDEYSPAVADYYPYACEAELASVAAASYHELAREDRRLTTPAETQASTALNSWSEGFVRSKVFDQVTLARIRFRAGDLERACVDGGQAIQLASTVSESKRVRDRLTQLLSDTTPYQRRPAVRELREQLGLAVAGGS